MKKMFLLFGMLAMVGVLFVACSDQQDLTSPEEAAFKKNKVTYECTDLDVAAQQADLEQTIRDQYLNNRAEKGALENVDNMARNICKDPQDLAAARATYFKFEIEVNSQNVAKLRDGEAGRQEILAKARAFVSGIPFDPGFVIPPEALEEDGGVGVVTPGLQDTIWTNNLEAAFVAEVGSFAGTDPVTVVLTRLADPQPGVEDYPIPGYQAYPEAYDFSANFPLIGEAEFWMCVVTDPPAPPFDRLVIGHDLGEGSELLTPRLVEDFPGQVLDCGNAVYIDPPVVGSIEGSGLLHLAASLLRPLMDRVLDVEPLNASYFGGKGLGGRGTSFSDFAPVDAGIEHPVLAFDRSELNQEVGESTVNYYYVGVTNWEDYPTDLFVLTSEFGPCGLNPTPSRTWVEIYDASDDSYIYRFCGFDSPDDLIEFWFATDPGQAPPDVYIELWDRDEDVRYRSNTIVIPTVFNTLTVEGAGSGTGTITRAPDIDCSYDGEVSSGDCTHSAEEWVRYGGLTATADEGSTFTGWSGACSGTDPCLVEMDADKTATATFTSTETFTLDILIVGNGSVTDDSEAIVCPESCSAEFGEGETVFLWGSPGQISYLDSVLGNCEEGGDPDCTIIMNQDESVEFLFQDIVQ